MIETIEFDLDRGMRDVKMVMQFMRNLLQKCVARMSTGHHQMRVERDACSKGPAE